jgi:hypothetical protein
MVKIYGFLEGPAAGGWLVSATCECGARLMEHVVAKAEDARDDIGVTSQRQHKLYREHCIERHNGEAFQVEWIDDPSNYEGLRQADVEVVDWNKDDFAALTGQLQKAFSSDDEKALPENDCQ